MKVTPCMITVYCGVSIQSYVLLFFKSVVGQNQKLVGPVNTDVIDNQLNE